MLDMAPSTVHAVLRRAGESRLSDVDRVTGVRIRYVKDNPGELVHLDVKRLGRIPDGGGHAILGNSARIRRGGGWEFYHVAVDDCSRVAFGQVLDHDDGLTAAEFLLDVASYFESLGVHIERVMTDRAYAYMLSKRFKASLGEIGAKHRPTKPFHPQTNGKAEAFIKTSLREWAYAQLYRSNAERKDALPNWIHYYVRHRIHTELGTTPMQALVNNVPGKYN
ncbi:transposase [bacterium]|nr:MAG: transposase [bacterium]